MNHDKLTTTPRRRFGLVVLFPHSGFKVDSSFGPSHREHSSFIRHLFSPCGIIRQSLFLAAIAIFLSGSASAQWPYASPTTPDAQRNALSALRSQINFFQNATRTASSYGQQGYGNVQSQFQALRDAYNALKHTLNPKQSADGGNAIAELDAGLDILQEAFGNFQNDIAAGRSVNVALRDMCQVLRQGTQLWSQQLNKTCSQLRIGWG